MSKKNTTRKPSEPGKPHPIIVAFLKAATEWKTQKGEDAVLA